MSEALCEKASEVAFEAAFEAAFRAAFDAPSGGRDGVELNTASEAEVDASV